jgi:hypothetical protein
MHRCITSRLSPITPFQHLRHTHQCLCLSSTADNNSRTAIAATEKWFETIVVGEKLCPFAPPLLQNPSLLRIVSSDASSPEEAILHVSKEVQLLVGQETPPTHETTLVVLDHRPFVKDFRDFVRLSWQLQEEAIGEHFGEKLQLVLFHPQATHQTYADAYAADGQQNPADYTIRSPFPTIHLLREVDVMKAVQGKYPNLETLPARNKDKFIQQGPKLCEGRLQQCHVLQDDQ